MKKKGKSRIKSRARVKAGVQCPKCEDIIFSMFERDFQRCKCGKIFVDGGDKKMRYGAEPPVMTDDIQIVYRKLKDAKHMMSRAVRDLLPPPPPPLSFFTERSKFQFVWSWSSWHWPSVGGPYPSTGKFAGAIYKWSIAIGPLEIRRWSDEKT